MTVKQKKEASEFHTFKFARRHSYPPRPQSMIKTKPKWVMYAGWQKVNKSCCKSQTSESIRGIHLKGKERSSLTTGVALGIPLRGLDKLTA